MPIKASAVGFTRDQLNKIGNTIIYLAENIKPLYKTKLLKLLYFIDELSVKKYSIPLLNLEYKVWQAGPVSSDIFQELDEAPNLLEGYISLEFDHSGTKVLGIKPFDDNEFSDNDIDVISEIVSKYKVTSAQELVQLAHRESSLWYKVAKENGLLELFESKKTNVSDFRIDLSDLIDEGSPTKKQLFIDHQKYLSANQSLKN